MRNPTRALDAGLRKEAGWADAKTIDSTQLASRIQQQGTSFVTNCIARQRQIRRIAERMAAQMNQYAPPDFTSYLP
jgi:hypothetical protein